MVAKKEKINFTEGKLFPQIVLFVLPIVATNLLQMLYNAADMMVVSLSPEKNAVGAVGVTGAFIQLIVNLFIGFSIGANVIVARHIGANDETKVQNAVHTALLSSLFFGIIGTVVGILLTRPVLQVMGITGKLLELAATYTYIYFSGVPFLALTNCLGAIFRAKGDAKTPLVVLTVAGLVNVVLNFIFVIFLKMSVEGVSLATMIANAISFVVLLIKLSKDKDATAFSFKKLRIDKKAFWDILCVGLPAGIGSSLFALSNILIQSSIVSVNNAVCPPGSEFEPIVNGSSAAGNIEGFIYTAMNAVAQGAITFTSQNMGAEKPERIKPILYNCYLLVTLLGLTTSLIVLLLKNPLLSLYGVKGGAEGSLESLALEAATVRMWFICLPYFLCGLMEVTSGVLRGFGRSLLSTGISLVGSCLLRIVWLSTVFKVFPTLETIFVCYPITWALTALVGHIAIYVILGKMKKEY